MKYLREILLGLLSFMVIALCSVMLFTGHPNPLTFPPVVLNLLRVDVFLMFVIIASKWVRK